MWDCHFRVGGADGSDLGFKECDKADANQEKCKAAALLLHIKPNSSGYFENVWVWTADQ